MYLYLNVLEDIWGDDNMRTDDRISYLLRKYMMGDEDINSDDDAFTCGYSEELWEGEPSTEGEM